MPINVTVTTTTPKDVPFFSDSTPENAALAAQLNAWFETLPGFLGITRNVVDTNTRVVTTTWDTLENYTNAMTARASRPEILAKKEYKIAHGISDTISETLT